MSSVNIMHEWFKYLFDVRKDTQGFVKCFECGKQMHEDTFKDITTCYSHILQKKKYPQYKGEEENVVIVHADCHNLYTMKPKLAINQYNKYIELKQKYEL